MFNTSEEELKHTFSLLKEERQAEFNYYRNKILNTPLNQRVKEGLCWYPVELKQAKLSTGEHYVLDIERSSSRIQAHVFAAGKAVSLFANTGEGKPESGPRANAVVNWVKKDRIRLTLNSKDLPDWLYDGKLGIDLVFDEASYRAMEAGMQQVLEMEGSKKILRDKLLGYQAVHTAKSENFIEVDGLNQPQQEALGKAVASQDIAIIHGPPGTGKTTTLVKVIQEVLRREAQVLVCAPSNAAVDLLADKLSAAGQSVLRLGHPARVNEDSLPYTVDARMASHPSYRELKKLRKQAEEYRNLAYKYKRKFGGAERQQRKRLLQEASNTRAQAEQLEYYILYDVMEKTQVFCATPVGAFSHQLVREIKFGTVFLDEAGQALEPAAWLAILLADRVIMAGDHQQLPPTIKSEEAAKKGLAETLFEKAITRTGNQTATMLQVQYRMHEHIMGFSSQEFYQGGLIADESVKNHTLNPEEPPVVFIDTAGAGFDEKVDPESGSKANPEEAAALLNYLLQLGERLQKADVLATCGIIAPYRAQVKEINEQFQANEPFKNLFAKVDIDTVDAFQGQERDIICISLTRSNSNAEIGFLADERRMNVALTRARKKLVVMGDSATFGQHAFYSRFLDYVQSLNAYHSVYEFVV